MHGAISSTPAALNRLCIWLALPQYPATAAMLCSAGNTGATMQLLQCHFIRSPNLALLQITQVPPPTLQPVALLCTPSYPICCCLCCVPAAAAVRRHLQHQLICCLNTATHPPCSLSHCSAHHRTLSVAASAASLLLLLSGAGPHPCQADVPCHTPGRVSTVDGCKSTCSTSRAAQ
jgi:hypothetical protein